MSNEPFRQMTAVTAPIIRENIDTDIIIPSREMKSVGKQGLAEGLFAGWRYTAIGGRDLNPDFVLNKPEYANTRFILGGSNFGCGSSREHAAWALAEYGIRAVVAPSFNPIFRGNCVRNGIVPVELSADAIAELAAQVEANPAANQVSIDLENGVVRAPDGKEFSFAMEPEAREMLLEGLDAIEITLKRRAEIDAFRDADRAARPWVYL